MSSLVAAYSMQFTMLLLVVGVSAAFAEVNASNNKHYVAYKNYHIPQNKELPFGTVDLESSMDAPAVHFIEKRDPAFFDNMRITDDVVTSLERQQFVKFPASNGAKRVPDDAPANVVKMGARAANKPKPAPLVPAPQAMPAGQESAPQPNFQSAERMETEEQKSEPSGGPEPSPQEQQQTPFEQQQQFPGQQQQQQQQNPPQPVAPFADGDPRDYVDMVPKWLACLNSPKKQQAFCTGCCVYRNTAGNPGNGVRGQCGFKDGVDSHPCFIPQEDVPGSGENLCFAHLTFSEADQACKHVCHFGKCGPGGSFNYNFGLRNDGNPNNVRSDHAPNIEYYSA